ncbi:hypothetical protein B484DRAFT_398374 [Ochromonadaceae sp. CCMP2298]|nr:hypothetical protein B484DRAFT_398374 [Ochromonadaceae sp. CCMP2298]
MQTRHRSTRRRAPAAAVPRQRTNRYGLELQAALARDPNLSSTIAANPAAYAQDLTMARCTLAHDDPTPVLRPTSPVASLLAEAVLGDLTQLLRTDGELGLADEMAYEGAGDEDWVNLHDDWDTEVAAFTQAPAPIKPLFVHPTEVARALAHAEAATAAQAERAEALASFEALTPETEAAVFGAATQADFQEMLAAEESQAEEEEVVVPAGTGPQLEHGPTTAAPWVDYLVDIESAPRYVQILDHFLVFRETQPNKTEKGLLASVGTFFRHERSMGCKLFTLRSRFSVLKKFWTHSGRGELPPQMTTMEESFAKWQKKDTIIQDRTFSAQNYAAPYRLHRNKETILWKALAAVGNGFAARGAEVLALTWGNMIRVTDAAVVVSYKIKYQRLKQQTSNSSESEYALLTCVKGVSAVDGYISYFPIAGRELLEHRAHRFWLRHNTSPTGLIHATWSSHNVGKTLVQNIEAYSGHKSDSVPQRYIDTSTAMKTVAATATATTAALPLSFIPSSIFGKHSSLANPNFSAASTYNINISVTGDMSGSLGLFGKE